MRTINKAATIPVLFFLSLLIAFPAFNACGEEPISSDFSITLGSLTAADFNFSEGSLQFPSELDVKKTLTLNFSGEADLDVKLVSVNQPAGPGIDLSHLKIGLVEGSDVPDENWQPWDSIGSWIDLGTFVSDSSEGLPVDYKLKYELAEAGVPAPYDYTIKLKFRLIQHTSELIIIKQSYNPGQNEVRMRVEDSTGSNVQGATVKVFKPDNYPNNPHDLGETGPSGYVWLDVPLGTSNIIVSASKGSREKKEKFDNPS